MRDKNRCGYVEVHTLENCLFSFFGDINNLVLSSLFTFRCTFCKPLEHRKRSFLDLFSYLAPCSTCRQLSGSRECRQSVLQFGMQVRNWLFCSQGSLAVSRALGDFEYKNVEGKGPTEQLVSPEPEVFIKERTPGEDEFLVLACDGVWDVMTNQDICDFIRSRLKLTDNLETICNEVIDSCLYKGSRDNMSIIIIAFPNAPKVDPAAIKAEKELNDKLEKKINELVSLERNVELSGLHSYLLQEDFEGLPPGGGLHAKRVFIEEIYKKLVPENYEAPVESPNPLASMLFVRANANKSPIEDN